ncbi:MAG: hypothetical protein WEA31_06980 [Pirellulales bacterium]
MIDVDNIPPVGDDELLARFIVNSNEFRQDDTVKPKLFMPYSRVELSVNRHRDCTETEIWGVGYKVAETRQRTLYGRADIMASSSRIAPLDVVPDPLLPANPNHAEITRFPPAKEDQQALAVKLAAAASKRLSPPDR